MLLLPWHLYCTFYSLLFVYVVQPLHMSVIQLKLGKVEQDHDYCSACISAKCVLNAL